MKQKRKRAKAGRTTESDTVIYQRSVLLTFGLIAFGVVALIWKTGSGEPFLEWPLTARVLFVGMPVFGATVAGIAIWAPAATVQKWARGADSHESGWILYILAFPCYVALWSVRRRK